ncbi:MAG: HupE/UreJ family protein [Pseudomonadota bacterium]|nr:HupE/UreJ family protein [Pseudomonadota bacterium]
MLACSGVAIAHSLSVSHLDIVAPKEGGPLRLELDLSIRDLALTLPLDANGDGNVTWGEITDVRAEIEALVARGLTVSSGTKPCSVRPVSLATRRYDDGAYVALALESQCAAGVPTAVRYTMFFDRDPQHRAVVTMDLGGRRSSAIAGPASTEVALGGASTNPFLDFLREGVHHILIGYDHIAFLLSLLLPVVLRRVNGKWEPVANLRSAVSQAAVIVTAFTIAHSITLSLAALGWVVPSSRWVEAAIAASVLLAALNNIWPVVTKRLWMAAFGFGLIHGFGFAGALSELGLPTGARVLSLLGFNLGVEAGQLGLVLVFLPLLYLASSRRWYRAGGMQAMSMAIALLAAWWLQARLFP